MNVLKSLIYTIPVARPGAGVDIAAYVDTRPKAGTCGAGASGLKNIKYPTIDLLQ